jgi:deoxyribonuclease V
MDKFKYFVELKMELDLESLKKQQIELSKKLNLKDKININEIRYIAGIDTTFLNPYQNPTLAISAIVVIDIKSFEIVEKVLAEKEIDFPYVPTFLAFRELPVILEAYKKLQTNVDVFILDGQGILHPRKMGIASHFGVITDTVSVGCGKTPLYGKYQDPPNQDLAYNFIYDPKTNEKIGYVLRTKKNTKPIFISPGNNISIENSLYVIIKSLNGYKLPEPIRLAHNFLSVYRKKLIGG